MEVSDMKELFLMQKELRGFGMTFGDMRKKVQCETSWLKE